VAWIRVSGPKAWEIAERIFRCKEEPPWKPRHCYFGDIVHRDEKIDEGFLILFEEGRSYTEELLFEMSCHGSPFIVKRIVNAIHDLGARSARPGEFTERAFMNGRIDLTQAEAVAETVAVATHAQEIRARLLREGKLSENVAHIEERIAHQLALAEATVDFSEEIGELNRQQVHGEIAAIIGDIDALLESAKRARLFREGIRVAVVGRPNVGKSSLLNALLGMERAIVTEIPGTTRDTIEEMVSIEGFPVVLTDTAGIRQTGDKVEQLGVERSKRAIRNADLVMFVYEAHLGWTEEDEELYHELERKPEIFVANKVDLGAAKNLPKEHLTLSALTGQGLDALGKRLIQEFETSAEIPLVNERHVGDLQEARNSLTHAAETLLSDLPTDLVCVDLHGALQAIGRITGRTATEEIIERVFRDFCLGK